MIAKVSVTVGFYAAPASGICVMAVVSAAHCIETEPPALAGFAFGRQDAKGVILYRVKHSC